MNPNENSSSHDTIAHTGTQTAERADPTTSHLENYLDYSVVDRNGDKLGSVDAVWQDHTGEPAYIGIKTGWLGLGKAHVVPADSVQVSEATRKIRLPYDKDAVKDAPAFDDTDEIDMDAEGRIADYYSQHGLSGSTEMDRSIENEDVDTGKSGTTSRDEVRMPLSSEEVHVGKREVEAGGVRLRKIIRTETVNQPVELQHEEIVVERVPASQRTPSRADVAFREEEVYVPLRREEAVVEKTAKTREEIRVGKRRDSERRDISETVRHEDVDIQKEGEAKNSTDKPRR